MTPKFVRFVYEGAEHVGVVDGDTVRLIDATRWPDLDAVVASGAYIAAAQSAGASIPLSAVKLLPPMKHPGKIICVGVNFPDRNEEYKDGNAAPSNPSLFIRFPSSFTGHNQPLIRPPESHQLDYEGEIAIVIGKAGRRISEADALQHIGALTLCNEGTLRDWVRHAKFNVTQGKNFERSGAMGPWLIPYHRRKTNRRHPLDHTRQR